MRKWWTVRRSSTLVSPFVHRFSRRPRAVENMKDVCMRVRSVEWVGFEKRGINTTWYNNCIITRRYSMDSRRVDRCNTSFCFSRFFGTVNRIIIYCSPPSGTFIVLDGKRIRTGMFNDLAHFNYIILFSSRLRQLK